MHEFCRREAGIAPLNRPPQTSSVIGVYGGRVSRPRDRNVKLFAVRCPVRFGGLRDQDAVNRLALRGMARDDVAMSQMPEIRIEIGTPFQFDPPVLLDFQDRGERSVVETLPILRVTVLRNPHAVAHFENERFPNVNLKPIRKPERNNRFATRSIYRGHR